MTDRVQLIIDLGALAAEAARRGEERAETILRRAVAFVVQADSDLTVLEGRRRADRDRPRRPQNPQKSAESVDLSVPPNPQKSTESAARRVPRNPQKSAESAEIGGIRGTLAPLTTEISTAVQEERTTTATESRDDYSARETSAESAESAVPQRDDRTERIVASVRASSGGHWPDVERFLGRRAYHTWAGWGDAMLKLVHPGSQYTWTDIAQVCRDDEALTRKVESPMGFRTFVLNARVERINAKTASEKARPAAVAAGSGRKPGTPDYGSHLK